MPKQKRKRKKESQSILGVRKISKNNQHEIKRIQDALVIFDESAPTHICAQDERAEDDAEKHESQSSISISAALDHLSRNRSKEVLQDELKRLKCRDAASKEALRRAEDEIILSSQCQSEFAMLYSRTQTGSLGSSPYVVLDDSQSCDVCENKNSMQIEQDSELVCRECGYTKPFVEYTLGNLSITEPREFYSCSYKRLNHLMDYLQHLQAKEEAPVPQNIITDVRRHLLQISGGSLDILRDRAPKRYILDQISQCIKGSRYPKRFGARTVQIMHKVLQVSIPRLLHGQIREIKNKFRYLSMLYFKFAPLERRNFLSYPFTAWILIDLICPKHALLDYIQLLKNLPKLRIQENTVRRIFRHLGWPFRDIPWKLIRTSRTDTRWKPEANRQLVDQSKNSLQNRRSIRVRLSGIKRK